MVEVALGELAWVAGKEKTIFANANAIAKLIFPGEQPRIPSELKQQALVI